MFLTFLLLFLLIGISSAHANNIAVSNSKVVFNNETSAFIEFDLSWENSWRDAINWDAAWVFVKYRESGGAWQHAWLSTNDNDHIPGTGTASTINIGPTNIDGTDRGMGAFIFRSANGSGTFSITNARLQWNFADQGVDGSRPVEIRVFAIEMVYVPQGAFWVGDGSTTSVRGHFRDGASNVPLEIRSESELTLGGTTAGNLTNENPGGMGTADDFNTTTTLTLPAAYPKGFAAFYMMKYSITQQQYVDFLNTLTRTQQNNRTETDLAVGVTSVTNRYVMSNTSSVSVRNGIRVNATIPANDPLTFYCDLNSNGTGGEADDGQWIAMNWLSWMDGAAYMDWSGLRPMTELEFEKAARGPANPVANEYAWGSTSITAATGISNAGANNETASNAAANAAFGSQAGVQGPLRVGAFAKAGSTREQAGASYWGIMELSGNLWERPVTVGNADGRGFTGLHGDGALSADGHATVTAWPGLVSGQVTDAIGSGFRGGNWLSGASGPGVSDRNFAALAGPFRAPSFGFRGVRSAPAAGVGE